MKKLFSFSVHGKLEAETKQQAEDLLNNLLDKPMIEVFKIQDLWEEARRD